MNLSDLIEKPVDKDGKQRFARELLNSNFV